MGTEIVDSKREETVSEAQALVSVIERAVANPEIDVEKMERLLAMQERVFERNAQLDFSAAMARVQANLPKVVEKSTNAQTQSTYAKHEALSAALKPVYTREGFSIEFSQGEAPKEDYVRVVGVLRHASGHEVERFVDLPLDLQGIKGNPNKTRIHATGSTFSYGRRYLTMLLFDVATGDDDDGQSGGDVRDIQHITDVQLSTLVDMVNDTGAEESAFCTFLGIEELAQLPQNRFGEALNALKKKKEIQKKRAEQTK